MKDVYLLPHPRICDVPHGRTREELHVRGLVATEVAITNDMTAPDLNGIFSSLLDSASVCGNGPVYLQSVREFATDFK